MRMTMALERRLFFLLTHLSCVVVVTALPTILLDHGRSKCLSIDAAVDTRIRVHYKAPDITLDQNSADYAPSYITINTRPANRMVDNEHESPVAKRLKPTNLLMTDVIGSVTHQMEVDGTANVCIRSTAASKDRPQRFGLRVIEVSEEELDSPPADVDAHLTHLEMEFERLSKAMSSILAQADFTKEREAIFHKQTQAMDNATMYWPIVQVTFLILTSFTQASHIVNFFKKRRII